MRDIRLLVCLLALGIAANCRAAQERVRVARVGNKLVWRGQRDRACFFMSGLAVDADGAPNAYHPQNIGLDDLGNAGHAGNWWALVTDTGKADGTPIIQGPNDPYPGYYVSMTSLEDTTKSPSDPHRYVDASTIPFFVLTQGLAKTMGARLGDLAWVVNTHNGASSPAMFVDWGPRDHLGEGSIALAKALGLNPDARRGGTGDGIVTIVFPGSGNGKPQPLAAFAPGARRLFNEWGGDKRLMSEYPTPATKETQNG